MANRRINSGNNLHVIFIVLICVAIVFSVSCGKHNDTPPRPQTIAETLQKYQTWYPGKDGRFIADGPNPYHQMLLEEKYEVVTRITSHPEIYADPVLPLDLIWLLGEIGDHRAFNMLLKRHCDNPDIRTSISLGACVDMSQVEAMFKAFDAKSKTIFLESVLSSEEYKKAQTFSDEEHMEYWKEHWRELKQRCMERSIPVLG